MIKKTKNLSKYPSQSVELVQKLCIQRFSANTIHAIRHCIVPNDCGIAAEDKWKVILYEDEDIVVCNKPSGMAVHFAKETQKYHMHSLVNFLLFHCPDLRSNIQKDSDFLKSSKLQNYEILPGAINELQLTISPGMVHRTDKQTSGLMVVGKTIFAMSNLLKQWKFHEHIEREYITLVHGKFDGNALRLKEDVDCDDNEDASMLMMDECHGNDKKVDGFDDIYSPDVAYSTFYDDEEMEQFYGVWVKFIFLFFCFSGSIPGV